MHLTREAFSRELEALRQEYKNQWGKTVAEKDLAALTQEILEELCYWDFAAVQEKSSLCSRGLPCGRESIPKSDKERGLCRNAGG